MKIGVLGHFGIGQTLLNGQTVKTNNLVGGIEKYTEHQVIKIDSHGWIKKPFRLLKSIKNAFRQCDAVIMLPAHNGVRAFAPLLVRYKKKYSKKIFYDVIGGWLPEFLKDKKGLSKALRSFDGIWTETNTMKRALEEQGFTNVVTVPNFKELKPLAESELVYAHNAPYRLCTFSRVMKEKGIETAVDAVTKVNAELGYRAFELDIYGQVDGGQTEWFEALKAKLKDGIEYKGCVDSSKSVEVLKDYFALLFPTHFYTEGIPGTIIDAYAAGIPVISAKWESCYDVVDDGITGVCYEFDDTDAFAKLLEMMAGEPQKLNALKNNCINKARDYMTAFVISDICKRIGEI